LSGDGLVWNRVSVVSVSDTPAGSSLNAPTTSGRTSPARVSTGASSTSSSVCWGVLTTLSTQSAAGRSTSPSSVPALASRSRSPSTVSRSP